MEKDDSGPNLFQTLFYATRAEINQGTDTKFLRTHDSISPVTPSNATSTIRLDGFVNIELFRSGISFLTGGTSKIQIGQTRYNEAYLENLSITSTPQAPPTCSMTFRTTTRMYLPTGDTPIGAYPPIDPKATGIIPDIAVNWQLAASDSRMNVSSYAAKVTTSIAVDRSYHWKVDQSEYDVDSFINRLEKTVVIDFTGMRSDELIPYSGHNPDGLFFLEWLSHEGRSFQIHMTLSDKTKLSQETWGMSSNDIANIRSTYQQAVL